MKKIFAIAAVAAAMLFAGKANAQVSVHAGYQNVTCVSSQPVIGETSVATDGAYLGFSYNMEAGAGLGVAPGLYLSYVENMIDLRVPILLNWGINMGEIGFGLFAGPDIVYGLSGDTYNEILILRETNRFGLDVTVGVQLKYQKISLDLGYTKGLLNRWKDAPDNCTYVFNKLFVGLGYNF